MVAFILTLIIFGVILLVEEVGWRQKLLRGEYQRKFVHMATGIFMAFWPWLITWHQIQILAALGFISALIYRRVNLFGGLQAIRTGGYGHITHPLAVLVSATLTHERIFFCLAILNMALADGLAAIVGSQFGKNWQYRVFGQLRTVVGSMTFWLVSLAILGVGLLPAHELVNFPNYIALVIILPPILVLVENLSVLGLDNLTVPLTVLAVLHWTGL